ncbi:MAG: helix-turn-helix domain-containing protein [Paludibacteraceae bacterium]|nr:helix-turn-helix domain-containing protein [Paludibacteraceae bacterium]
MRRANKQTRAFRRAIAIEYLQSGARREEIALKYGLPSVQTVSNWVNCYLTPYEIKNKCVSLSAEKPISSEEMMNSADETNKAQASRIEALEKQVKLLEAKLKKSQDRNLALNTLIDIAEEQGIRIRKKSGVKQ